MAKKFFGSEEPIDERNINNPPKKVDGWIAKFRAKLEARRAEKKRLAEEAAEKKKNNNTGFN